VSLSLRLLVVACTGRSTYFFSSSASILQATYTAIYELGCLAGAVVGLFFGNKLGRRRMIQLGASESARLTRKSPETVADLPLSPYSHHVSRCRYSGLRH
jgi:hypothetical protein